MTKRAGNNASRGEYPQSHLLTAIATYALKLKVSEAQALTALAKEIGVPERTLMYWRKVGRVKNGPKAELIEAETGIDAKLLQRAPQ